VLACRTTGAMAEEQSVKPSSWDDLVRLSEGKGWGPIARLPDVQRAYEEYKALVCNKFANYSDVIKIEHLRFIESKDTPHTAILTDTSLTTALTSTPFPSALDDERIEQHILWSLEMLSAESIRGVVERQYAKELFEYVYYENKPEDKTIPDLWHVHVYVRPKDQ